MPPSSSSSVAIKSVDIGVVRAAADRWAHSLLAARPDVDEIVVFGSFEMGCWAPGSDLDVLIVLAASDQAPRDRIPSLLPGTFPVPVDVFPFTHAELLDRSDSPIVAAANVSRWRYVRAARSSAEKATST